MSTSEPSEPFEPEIIELPKEKKKGLYPTLIDLVAIFGIYALTQLVGVVVSTIIIDDSNVLQMAKVLLLSQVISMSLFILCLTMLRKYRKAEKPKLSFSIKGFDASILLKGFIMMIAVAVVIEPILVLLPPTTSIEARGWPLIIAVILGAPIFEEIICRGILFGSMRLKWGVGVAWLGSSLFFGLMHLEPAMIVNAFFMGLILCYFAIRSKSLIAPIILHMMNNALAYIFIMLGWGDNVYLRDLISNPTLYSVIYAVAAVIFIVSLVLCRYNFKKIITQNSQVEEQPLQ